MTEDELKAIKWMRTFINGAMVTLQKESNINDLICVNRKEKAETIIKGFEELERYRQIGSADKCQIAMDKQIEQKVNIWGDGYNNEGEIIYDMYSCPNCGKSYEIDYEEYTYCPNCGQRILIY